MTKEFKVSPTNVKNIGGHYFYGYGATHEEALQNALELALERDPEAFIKDGHVYFKQAVYF